MADEKPPAPVSISGRVQAQPAPAGSAVSGSAPQGFASAYANVATVRSNGEEVAITFGLKETGATEAEGRLVQRMLLSPPAAKRLAATLADALAEHEARFGAIHTA
ncbi:MAG: DUF3467 domain-containing protein [Rhodospirillales bacterium]|nr:DUF3467 domain-containing protein [Rhodospirillales bacterium]